MSIFIGADNAAIRNLNPSGKSAARRKPSTISPIVASVHTIGNFTSVVMIDPITETEAIVKDNCPHEPEAHKGACPGDSPASFTVN